MTQATRPYHSHRENQRGRILEAAERLFIERGIDSVNMSDIARAAQMTRNTVYEYFPNKHEVAWAILEKIFTQGQAFFAVLPEGSGYQQIAYLMTQVAGQVETQPEHLRYFMEFDTLYAREANADRMRQVIGQARAGEQDICAQLVRRGMLDGSLRADLDPDLVSAAIWNLLSGMNNRFALLSGLIQQEYRQPAPAIYQEILRAFLRGIQSTQA